MDTILLSNFSKQDLTEWKNLDAHNWGKPERAPHDQSNGSPLYNTISTSLAKASYYQSKSIYAIVIARGQGFMAVN